VYTADPTIIITVIYYQDRFARSDIDVKQNKHDNSWVSLAIVGDWTRNCENMHASSTTES
jgi:hypothetical protein